MWKGARLKNIHPLLKKVNYCCKVSTFKLCQGKSFKWCFAQVSLIFSNIVIDGNGENSIHKSMSSDWFACEVTCKTKWKRSVAYVATCPYF